jgi:outer membrane protein
MRISRILVGGGYLIAALALAVTSSAQEPIPQAPAATEQRVTVSLEDLVLTALQRNLGLQTRRTQNRIIATDIQRAQSVFDPGIDFAPALKYGSSQAYPPSGIISNSGTQGDMSASLSGTLPFSATYAASLSSNWIPGVGAFAYSNNLSLHLSQPLLRGRGSSIVKAQIESALLAADSSDQSLLRIVEETIGAVETAYWTLGLAESIEGNARDSVARSQELLHRNQQLADLELLSEADLVTAQAGEQERRTALIDAVRSREDAADALLFLVYGREASAQLQAWGVNLRTEPPSSDAPELPKMAELEGQVAGNRHDIQAAQYEVDRSRVSLRVADNDRLPQLNLVGGYSALTEGINRFAFYSVPPGGVQFDGLSAGAVFTYSIRNNDAKAAFAEATLAVERGELNVSTLENNIRREVRSAVRGVTFADEKLDEARESTELQRQRYANGQEQLKLGLIDSFRLLLYELDVTRAELVESRSLYSLANAVTRYELAVGKIDEKYISGGATAAR